MKNYVRCWFYTDLYKFIQYTNVWLLSDYIFEVSELFHPIILPIFELYIRTRCLSNYFPTPVIFMANSDCICHRANLCSYWSICPVIRKEMKCSHMAAYTLVSFVCQIY